MTRSELLAGRQAELVARCAEQRLELVAVTSELGRSLWFVDYAVVASRRAAAHPALLAGVLVAAVVIGPSRIARWIAWGFPVLVAFQRGAALWTGRSVLLR
jgi:hypothetical protein